MVESQYPPKETIKLQVAHNLELESAQYKDSRIEGSIDKRDIKKIHQQLNYTNTVLDIMKNQLERIEHKHEQIKSIEKPIYKF
ncbi:hypothetical protein AHAS_Ahas17G0222700 [Arachis hypogaea]